MALLRTFVAPSEELSRATAAGGTTGAPSLERGTGILEAGCGSVSGSVSSATRLTNDLRCGVFGCVALFFSRRCVRNDLCWPERNARKVVFLTPCRLAKHITEDLRCVVALRKTTEWNGPKVLGAAHDGSALLLPIHETRETQRSSQRMQVRQRMQVLLHAIGALRLGGMSQPFLSCSAGCTAGVLSTLVDGFTCESRMQWLVSNQAASSSAACQQVAREFQAACGACALPDPPPAPPVFPPVPSPSTPPALRPNSKWWMGALAMRVVPWSLRTSWIG